MLDLVLLKETPKASQLMTSYEDIFTYIQKMEKTIEELVPNQVLVEEYLQNVLSFSRYTSFTPIVH